MDKIVLRFYFEAILTYTLLEGNRITPIKTGFAEMILRIIHPRGLEKSFKTQIIQGIKPENITQLIDCLVGGNEFAPGGKIDSIMTWKTMWRATDTHMDSFDPEFA